MPSIINEQALGKMIGISDIQAYATTVPTFSCKQMFEYFDKENKPFSPNTTISCIKRLLAQGVLEKVKRGEYRLASRTCQIFTAFFDAEQEKLSKKIREEFPFIRFCVWSSVDIKRFSHYVVNMNILFVDVERGGEETVFHHLLNLDLQRQIYLQPTLSDYTRYIYGKPTIVVRTLISEAPLVTMADGLNRVTIEKILVDSVIDVDFYPFQEFETFRLFRNALDTCRINEKKLLRYAARRNHKAEIENIIAEVKQNEIFD